MKAFRIRSLFLCLLLALAGAATAHAGVATLCHGEPNGILDGDEQCETGPCCTGACELRAAETVCGGGSDPVCDPARACGKLESGVEAACPAAAPVEPGTACDDGLFCTIDDACSGTLCSGTPRPCDDSNACTSDACNELTDSCDAFANTAPCDDGLYCNGDDTCSGGECSAHAGDPCGGPDGDSNCTGSCDEDARACTANDPAGTACDDADACTTGDTCSNGQCVSGTREEGCVTTTTIPETTTTLPPETTTTLAPDTTTTTLEAWICGDVNHDGKIMAGDAHKVLRAAVGLGECPLRVCDFNGDGEILASDALGVLRTAVGLDSNPMCPLEG